MAMTNFTEDGSQKSYESQRCSAEVAASLHNQLICRAVLNTILSIAAFLGNILILAALYKESALHPPSKVLLRSLATADLCVGIIVEPIYLTYLISAMNERWDICRFNVAASFITGYTFCLASLLTLAVITVDRLLALLLGLRYRQVVTLKRTYLTVVALWAVFIVGSIMFLFSKLISYLCGIIIVIFSLVTSIYCYTKIFLRLRQHQTQVQQNFQGQPNQTIPLNIARYRKTVSSIRWLQLASVACYLPYAVVVAVVIERRTRSEKFPSSLFLASASGATLVHLNSLLNPILYCWKIREVRQAVKETVRELCMFT